MIRLLFLLAGIQCSPALAGAQDLLAQAEAKAAEAHEAPASGIRHDLLARDAESLYVGALESDCALPTIVPYLKPAARLSRRRYEKAIKACAATYRSGSPDREANLSVLYVRAGDEGHGLERLALALGLNPSHHAALAYITDQRLWSFIDDTSGRISMALRAVPENAPEAIDAKRGLLRVLTEESRFVEAWLGAGRFGTPDFTVALAERAWELRDFRKAVELFEQAASTSPERTAVYDLLAYRQLSVGNYEAAVDAALRAASEPVSSSDREDLQRRYGRFNGIQLVGEAALERLDFKTALKLLDVEQFEERRQQLSLEVAGVVRSQMDDKAWPEARASLQRLMALQPANTSYLSVWSQISLRSDRYSDAVAGFTRLERTTGLTEEERLWKAEATLRGGDYEGAFSQLYDLYPLRHDRDTYQWLLAAGYGARGWDWLSQAIALDSQDSGREFREVQDEDVNAVWDKCGRAAVSADRANARYAAIEHYSVLTAFVADVGDKCRYCADAKWVEEQDAKVRGRAVSLYRSLAVKPIPKPSVVALAAKANETALSGDWWRAERAYQNALDRAPWWPEGWYNYAVMLGLHAVRYPSAIANMEFVTSLTSDRTIAKRAQAKIERWRAAWKGLGCADEALQTQGGCEALR